jgi:hypothetical protein
MATVIVEPLRGYKVVNGDGSSIHGDAVYVVGQRVTHPPDQPLVPCLAGLHMCPDALACLFYVKWNADRRLLEVVVPSGTEVVADGPKMVCRALDVVADVTDQASTLLTGTFTGQLTPVTNVTVCFANGLKHRDNGEPASVTRTVLGDVAKRWFIRGDRYDGYLDGRVAEACGRCPRTVCCWTARDLWIDHLDDGERTRIYADLTRRESFEPAAP